jgi:hypothetical protein
VQKKKSYHNFFARLISVHLRLSLSNRCIIAPVSVTRLFFFGRRFKLIKQIASVECGESVCDHHPLINHPRAVIHHWEHELIFQRLLLFHMNLFVALDEHFGRVGHVSMRKQFRLRDCEKLKSSDGFNDAFLPVVLFSNTKPQSVNVNLFN